jgi:hypothetical protein
VRVVLGVLGVLAVPVVLEEVGGLLVVVMLVEY